jgi:hypothetical protein
VKVILTIRKAILLKEIIGRKDLATFRAVEMLRMPFFSLGCNHLARLKIVVTQFIPTFNHLSAPWLIIE